jgi:hypothetical protein
MALQYKVTALKQPSLEKMGTGDGGIGFTGHEASPPIHVWGIVTDGWNARKLKVIITDASAISEWALGVATTSLNSAIQTWVNANLVDAWGKLGDKWTDTAVLTASQEAYIPTTLTPV